MCENTILFTNGGQSESSCQNSNRTYAVRKFHAGYWSYTETQHNSEHKRDAFETLKQQSSAKVKAFLADIHRHHFAHE